jgi:transposase
VVSFEVFMNIEHRLIELERRRRRGARLLQSGIAQAEVARRVGVTRTSVSRWEKLRQDGGIEALRRPKRFGRPRRLTDAQCAQLIEQLKAGALSAGFGTELWTLPRIRTLILQRFAVTLTEPSVWRLLRALGWSVQRPSGQARARDEKAIRTWKARRWPELKKSQRDKAG